MGDWQPIETMPRDGTRFLVNDGRYTRIAWVEPTDRLDTDLVYVPGWGTMRVTDFTHWMPLPTPPKPVNPQRAVPNTAYHRIPAPGQRVKIVAGDDIGREGEVRESTAGCNIHWLGVVLDGLTFSKGYTASEVLPIGDNPRFILVPAE